MKSKITLLSLALLLLLGAAFTLYKFLPEAGSARHIDTQWLVAASACLLDGQLPYDIRQFELCWISRFGDTYLSSFVFGAPIFGLIWPLGAFETPTAFLIVDLLNATAVLLLAAALWAIAEPQKSVGLAQILRVFWIFLGVTIGGLAGSGFVGQPVILSALGAALLYLAMRRKSTMSFLLGSLLCLVKPHITLMALCYAWIMGRGLARARLYTACSLAGLLGLLFLWDQTFVQDFFEALEVHSASNAAKIADPSRLFGMPHIISRFGAAFGGLLIVIVGGLAFAMAYFLGVAQKARAEDCLFFAALVGGLFVFPVKGYDLGVLAAAFAVIGTLSWRAQLAYLVPMLLLWRPGLLGLVNVPSDDIKMGVTLIAFGTAAAALGLALQCRNPQPKA